MDIMSMKGHPPWYARGTPVTNIRDGPAMAINDKLLFAICRGSSARGIPGKCMNEVRRPESEDRSRCKPMGKIRRWLTLNITFFKTQHSVFSHWYVLLGRKWDIIVDADRACPGLSGSKDAVRSGAADLSACVAPDNVKLEMDDNVNWNGMSNANAVKSKDVDRLEEAVVGFDLSA